MKLQCQTPKQKVIIVNIIRPRKIIKWERHKQIITWEPGAWLKNQCSHASLEDKADSEGGGNDRTPWHN